MSVAAIRNLFARVTMRTVVGAQNSRRVKYSMEHKNRFYTWNHAWISMDLFNQTGTIGISNWAQEKYGQMVFANLPEPGALVRAEEECALLEAAIGLVVIYTPVTGVVTQKNYRVESDPTLINKSCHKDGWLFRVRVVSLMELRGLMNEAAYEQYIKEN